MCGIAGIFGPGAVRYTQAVQKMADAMAHRGPDGQGLYVSPSGTCVLGHRRLAILDVSDAASQPMVSKGGRWAFVYNGECYNFRELRDELPGEKEPLRSSGDTEVLFRLLIKQGEALLPRLNAMFALGLWDEERQSLFLARDRYGQKPLYFARINGLVLFASEVRALLASGLIERLADPNAIRSYLSYGAVHWPLTIVSGVELMPPASYMIFGKQDRGVPHSYWVYPKEKKDISSQELRENFISAVESHLVSDVPLGIFLSGGIDSSALVAAAAQSAKERVKTLCVTFPEQQQQSEARYASMMASRLGTEHHEIPVTGQAMLDMLQQTLEAMDQPTGDAINTYVVSYAARQVGLKVALSGLGGDELFGGYSTFSDIPWLVKAKMFLKLMPSPALELLHKSAPFSVRISKFVEMMDGPLGLSSTYLARRRVLSWRQIKKITHQCGPDQWQSGLSDDFWEKLENLILSREIHDAIGLLEISTYMRQTLLRDADVMGMAHGLEIRLPFLDAQFASSALTLPSGARKRGLYPKWRFADAMGDWLPQEIVRRPKMGFTLPFEEWMQKELKKEMECGLHALVRVCPLLKEDALLDLWRNFLAHPRQVGWSRPWILYVLGNYLERHKLKVKDELIP